MRLSFDWLCDFVDLSGISPQDVAQRLTWGAFEVEEVRKVGPDVEGPLMVGEIVEINPHPNADKIRLAKVKLSKDAEPQEIVCGAPNIIVGQRVPVALPGARVINRHDGTALHIKPTKIRGVESNGMLCSASELGIPADEDGILILYGLPELGADVRKLLNLYPDWIFHVEPRSNRGDALSVLGMAREIAAVCDRELVEPKWQLPDTDQTSECVQLHLENQQDCPFFSIRILQGLHVKPSSLHIRRRLEAVGVRPINNVVDVTNYVLHELGQPLHAYDLARLKGPVMEVRRARSGEKLLTLDGRERDLTPEVLVVADSACPVGIAGVMGGKDSEVTEETAFVALEAACFNSARVRRSGRLLGLSSDSSLRFERGVDVASVRHANDRAAYLMLENCSGFLGRISSAGDDKVKPVTVDLRLSRLKQLLEIDLQANEVGKLISPLGFETSAAGQDKVTVSVPSFRQKDVSREIDLVEEVCRRWGYNRIPVSMPKSTIAPSLPDNSETLSKEALAACGLNETWSSSLVGDLEQAAEDDKDKTVKVLNPLSADHQALRQSLLPGLISAVVYNQDRGARDIWLFETGRVYSISGTSTNKDPGTKEELRVGAVLYGSPGLGTWQNKAGGDTDFYTAKGIVENLLDRLSVVRGQIAFNAGLASFPKWFHPGRSCSVELKNGKETVVLGHLGEIHPAIVHSKSLRQSLYLFELSIDLLKENLRHEPFREIHTTPSVVRDLTIDIAESIEQQAVHACITRSAGAQLKAADLVSTFQLEGSLRSLSYRLVFQHPEETLTAEQVDKSLFSIREALKTQLSAAFRQ